MSETQSQQQALYQQARDLSDKIFTIGEEELWVVVESAALQSDGFFHIQDSTGGDILVNKDDIPALIEALKNIQEEGTQVE